jgi:hypothetical protein
MARVIITVTSPREQDVEIDDWSHSPRSEPQQRQILLSRTTTSNWYYTNIQSQWDIVYLTEMTSPLRLDRAAKKTRGSFDRSYSIDSDDELR